MDELLLVVVDAFLSSAPLFVLLLPLLPVALC